MKVAVYTIALNEAVHAERWAASAADADYRVVADTGSTDTTVEALTRAGVCVHRIAIRPWRFDDARNAALALLPADADVCVSMDMDEFLEPGWRSLLEGAWVPDTTALFCQLALRSDLDDPNPNSWPAKKFHSRWGYRFTRPVHEALSYVSGEEVTRNCNGIVISHIKEKNKGTRNQYMPLLEIAHSENPQDSQICFWLGRDYVWNGRAEDAIAVLQRYLDLRSSTWREERAEAMRLLARAQPDQRMFWLDRARLEAPHRRETWLDLAEALHDQENWLDLFWACNNAIEKTYRTGSYLDDNHAWGFRLFDLLAIACWKLGLTDRAVDAGRKALELDPGNFRLKANLEFFERLQVRR